MKNKELYMNAIETYGQKNQIMKTIEEMAELTSELCRYQIGQKDVIEKVQNELADCLIMLDQMEIIFGTPGMVDEERDAQLGNDFESKSSGGLISKTIGVIGETQIWLSGYDGECVENQFLRGHFLTLRGYFDRLADQFDRELVDGFSFYKLRCLELRLEMVSK